MNDNSYQRSIGMMLLSDTRVKTKNTCQTGRDAVFSRYFRRHYPVRID